MKLRLRKNDFDRVHSIEQKKEIMNHKERTEQLYRHKLEQEKRKIMSQKREELDLVIKENKTLKDEIAKVKIAFKQ